MEREEVGEGVEAGDGAGGCFDFDFSGVEVGGFTGDAAGYAVDVDIFAKKL